MLYVPSYFRLSRVQRVPHIFPTPGVESEDYKATHYLSLKGGVGQLFVGLFECKLPCMPCTLGLPESGRDSRDTETR